MDRLAVGCRHLRSLALPCAFAAWFAMLGGCASVARWSEFHGNPGNTGYVGVNTPVAELASNRWTQKVGPTGFSSPAIAPDGTIYVGNMQGQVWGWNPDGTLRQSTQFPAFDALSSMAIGEDGILHYTVLRNLSGTNAGLYCRTSTVPALKLIACRDFPDGGITTAPPKIWTYQGATYAFVPSYRDAQRDLLVYRDGELVHRHFVDCPAEVRGGNDDVWKIIVGILTGGLSLAIPGANPFEFKVPGIDRREWHLDPAVGVWDRSAEGRAVLVAAFSGCPVQGLEWRPDTGRIVQLWRRTAGVSNYYSSPAIASNGTTSIGRDDGHVHAFHALTGTLDWDFDAGEAVLATPAIAPGGDVYVVALRKAYVVSGWAGGTATQSFALPSATNASPAISNNRVYIAHSTGMVTLDLTVTQTQVHDGRVIGGLSSPVIGKDGSVYVVSNDGYLFSFK